MKLRLYFDKILYIAAAYTTVIYTDKVYGLVQVT